jgi:sugar phosphate isomerase/epimerase
MKNAVLGVNHQFLYPEAMVDAAAHTETLKKAALLDSIDALDCWVWRGQRAREEISILRSSGKVINYNIGDRFGEAAVFPCSPEKADRIYAYDTLMREVEYAMAVGSKKIVFASGRDLPEDRSGAKERLAELIALVSRQLPRDVVLALEPTDRDIDKHFLLGPLDETVDFIKKVRRFVPNLGLLLDMCHVPLMHETLESAMEKVDDTLVHIHLGNCKLDDPDHPFYGDKHIPWGYEGALYGENEGVAFLGMLKKIGYFDKMGATVSFEMRPYDGMSAEESLNRWVEVWERAKNS